MQVLIKNVGNLDYIPKNLDQELESAKVLTSRSPQKDICLSIKLPDDRRACPTTG